jgi:hypothetical protein
MTEHHPHMAYSVESWQNHDRRLTLKEFNDITRRVSGIHFAKEQFRDDPFVMQLLYAAEALHREVTRLTQDNPFPEEE